MIKLFHKIGFFKTAKIFLKDIEKCVSFNLIDGIFLSETQKTLDKLEDVSTDEKQQEKVRRKISRAKVMMRDKIEGMNSDDSFEEIKHYSVDLSFFL